MGYFSHIVNSCLLQFPEVHRIIYMVVLVDGIMRCEIIKFDPIKIIHKLAKIYECGIPEFAFFDLVVSSVFGWQQFLSERAF